MRRNAESDTEGDGNASERQPREYEEEEEQEEENREHRRPSRLTSPVWKYFRREVRGSRSNKKVRLVQDVKSVCTKCEEIGAQYVQLLSKSPISVRVTDVSISSEELATAGGQTWSIIVHILVCHISPPDTRPNSPQIDHCDFVGFLKTEAAFEYAPMKEL